MKLSLSGFLFEDNYTTQSLTFSRFCALARSAGYSGVELRRTQVNPDTPVQKCRELLDCIKDSGLSVTCLTARGLPASGGERDEFFLRYLDLCRNMGCNLMKIGADTLWLSEAAEKAEGYGVTLATNNHIGTMLETVDGTRRYFRQIGHPNFALLYDSLHLMTMGEDYLGCIPEFAGVTRNILVHSLRPARAGEKANMERNGKRWISALPDEPGVQDWSAIFSTFKSLNYEGLITVIESGWPVEKREYVARHCAKVLRHLWKI